MGRTKKKTGEEILEQCCMLFWEKGYAQTSIKDIEHATGLQPGSVYHQFKNKEALFERVLDHYISTVAEPRLKEFLYTQEGTGLKNIRNVFDSVLAVPAEYRWIGCLMTNSSVEIQNDPAVKKRIQRVFKLFEKGFLNQINRMPAMKKKPLRQHEHLAANLLVAMEGVVVLVRLGIGDKQLKKYIEGVLYPFKVL